jgi:hypothetical protein
MPSGDTALLHADLAAALLERHRRTLQTDDAIQALAEAQRALVSDPRSLAALFNRAVALEALGRPEARGAWAAYLDRDGTSGWAVEARHRLEGLR